MPVARVSISNFERRFSSFAQSAYEPVLEIIIYKGCEDNWPARVWIDELKSGQ